MRSGPDPALGRRRRALVAYYMVDRARNGRYTSLAIAARDAGATRLELGFPFSDPIADGPILQEAADRALHNGTHWDDLRSAIRDTSKVLPTIVMSYANPLWTRGLARSLANLREAGAAGLIVPDLSLEESPPWRRAARRAGLDLTLLAAPGSPLARIDALARASRGFLYLVSRYGTTGGGEISRSADLVPLVRSAHAAAPELPVYVGFGIRDRRTARRAMASGADGVIVASALESALARRPSMATVPRVLRPIASAVGTGGA